MARLKKSGHSVDSAEVIVDIPTPEIAFDVKVSDFNDTVTGISDNKQWKNTVTVTHSNTSDNLKGFKITYNVSEVGPKGSVIDTYTTSSLTTRNSSGIASHSFTKKKSGKVYYVWATARHNTNGKTFESTNYLKITLGHKHSSQTRSSTSCYGAEKQYCTGDDGYYVVTSNANWASKSKTELKGGTADGGPSRRYCFTCCTELQGKYTANDWWNPEGDYYYTHIGSVVCRSCRSYITCGDKHK